ncbi:hypothetical protein TNCV_3767031 [Trichonephila clavipes]|nr:hypothetical protein TNCV_3767031 [Trichonephila clavipes]
MTSYDLAKKKDELVSELKTLPPCTRDDCKEHKIPPFVEDSNDPIETKNNFSDLEQDVEHPLPTNENVISETITPPTKPPYPVMLKIKDNFRDQMKLIINKFPNLRNRIVGDVVKMFSNDHEERRSLIQFLKTDIDFEFYVIDVKKISPLKQ